MEKISENKLLLEIVTPSGLVFSGNVDEITAAGSEGEFGILPGHTNFITTLKVGMLTCKNEGQSSFFFVNSGYAEVGSDKVTILADSAEKSGEIDVERAKAAIKRAEERLRQAEEIDVARATAALERATMRVQVSGRHLKS
jgi:F-type H+-transporting ATPase subunit epsilon